MLSVACGQTAHLFDCLLRFLCLACMEHTVLDDISTLSVRQMYKTGSGIVPQLPRKCMLIVPSRLGFTMKSTTAFIRPDLHLHRTHTSRTSLGFSKACIKSRNILPRLRGHSYSGSILPKQISGFILPLPDSMSRTILSSSVISK